MRDGSGKGFDLLGVQEAVGSNPAVPTFKCNNIRALMRRPFSLCYTLSYTFDPKKIFELAIPRWPFPQ
jgi:hypothetical protein